MSHQKIAFIILLAFSIVFIPLAGVSTFFHIQTVAKQDKNKKHEFFFEGKLYFYDQENLLGTYTCENIDYCNYAVKRVVSNYPLLEPESSLDKFDLIENRYALLMDSTMAELNKAEILLYDVQNKVNIDSYLEIKEYKDHLYFAKNKESKWGLLEIKDSVTVKIPFVYDHMGSCDQEDEIAVLKDNSWYLIDQNNQKLSSEWTSAIVNYNDSAVLIQVTDGYQLLSYEGLNILSATYPYLRFCKPYLAVVDTNHLFYLYDLENRKEISGHYTINNIEDLRFETINNRMFIYNGQDLLETIAIS